MLIQTGKFTLTAESVDACSACVGEALRGKSVEEDNLVRLRLKLESVLMIWRGKLSENTEIRVSVESRLSRYVIRIFAAGSSVNPLKLSTEKTLEEEITFFYNLASNSTILSTYEYYNSLNVVEFTIPRKPMGSLGRMSLAMGGGIAVGLLGQFLLPPEMAILISRDFVSPVIKAIMGLIGGVASIYVFISIVAAVCNMDNVNRFSNVGKRIILAFGGLNLLALLLSGLIFWRTISSAGLEGIGFYDCGKLIYQLILRIVPDNLVKPFVEKDAMQLLFLSIFVGQLVSVLGTKVRALREVINNLNALILEGLSYACRGLPIAVFFCMVDLVLRKRLNLVLNSWQLLAPVVAITYLISLLVCFWAYLKGAVNFGTIIGDLQELLILGGTTGSRTPCLAKMHEICRDRLHLDKSLTDIGIPLSSMFMVNAKVSGLVSYTFGALMFYQMEISISQFVIILLLSGLVVYTTPPIPMGGMAIVSMIFTALGIPETMISIIMPIDLVSGFILTPPVVLATVVTLAIVNQSVEK